MKLRLRIIPLFIYWAAIFTLTHLSPLQISHLAIRTMFSDKIQHFLAYLVLTFLIWFAVGPEKKVNWFKKPAWMVLAGIMIYAILDEWLQGYVMRSPDIRDFGMDMAAAFTGLLALSIFTFSSAGLFLAGVLIVVLNNFVQIGNALIVNLSILSHLVCYGIFTTMWIWYMQGFGKGMGKFKQLALAVLLPVGFMCLIQLTARTNTDLKIQNLLASLAGILIIFVCYLIAKKILISPASSNDSETLSSRKTNY
jgi:VanZ family protein